EAIDAALGNSFRLANLSALRELALLWLADRVEDALQAYLADHNITGRWETRERVVVGLAGVTGEDHVVRRAARMAQRAKGDLLGVHVLTEEGAEPVGLAHQRELLGELGGRYYEVASREVVPALVGFATNQHATQLVLGASQRSRWAELIRGSIINGVIRRAGTIDVHVISSEEPSRHWASMPRLSLLRASPLKRSLSGFAIGIVGLTLLTVLIARDSALLPAHPGPLTSGAGFLIFLLLTAAAATVGGLIPALATAVAAAAAVDYYLVPPYGSFVIARGGDALSLFAFILCAGIVSVAVEEAARRRLDALKARGESNAVLALAERLAQPNPVQAVIDEMLVALGRDSVTLLAPQGSGWGIRASAGRQTAHLPDDGEPRNLRNGCVLVMTGPPMDMEAQRLVLAFVAYLEAMMAIHDLQSQAGVATQLSAANELRTALLGAVSHDFRTPLASIKALATGLLEPDVAWSREDTQGFLRMIDADCDRLNKLVDNLLDMSRIQTRALHLSFRAVGLDEVVPAALASLSTRSRTVMVDVPETLPRVWVDPALLERCIANVVDNAIRHSPPGVPVRVRGGEVGTRVDLRVVDQGPGIPMAERDRLFQPFQRLGDTDNGTGVGLGLAVSRGFLEAMGAELTFEDTPGGGATMVISLPVTPAAEHNPAEAAGTVGAATGLRRPWA
ncbi:MAG TPA: ATP-binding protein, partial [Actinomycetota bacterium]|nr:ATP-binding protein [Actinomycetota bacterium]